MRIDVDKDGYGFKQKFPICDGLLDSLENNLGPSTAHWSEVLSKKKGAIDELARSKDGRAFLGLILSHYNLGKKVHKLLQKMKDGGG